mgnify:CR=1 FL=1
MKISKNLVKSIGFDSFLDGKKVGLFTLENSNGMVAQITNYGGRIVSLFTPDKAGNFEDIVLGHEDLKGYTEGDNPYFGAIIGRYGNRIAKGRLEIAECAEPSQRRTKRRRAFRRWRGLGARSSNTM